MKMDNKCFVMVGPNEFKEEIRQTPALEDNEILVKIEYCGICGSDVHLFQTGVLGVFNFTSPMVLGHESAGTIVEAGKKVTHLSVGDRVALEPGVACGKCSHCKEGNYNLCQDVVFMATPPYDGAFMQYVKFPADMAFKLPNNVSCKEGALVEPLAVGLYATHRGEVGLGSKVIIFGAGCIGLVTLLSCLARGAKDVIVVDVVKSRLDFAKQLGAKYVINASENDTIKVAENIFPIGADVAIDCTGSEKCIQTTAFVVRSGGKIVMVGMGQDVIPFNFTKIMWKEIDIKTVFRYKNLYPVAINAIANGVIDVKKIATHEFDLGDLPHAFDYVINNKEEVIKAVVKIN
jgi:L-iditol 2-dehydrogenase